MEAIYSELKTLHKLVIATTFSNVRAMSPQQIVSRLSLVDPKIDIRPSQNIQEALFLARTNSVSSDLITITGSMYLVAEAREQLKVSEAL